MDYTPRQVLAFLVICQQRRKAELREQLAVGLLASRGDEKAVRQQFKAWDD
jgi:hypothetical protein